MNDSDRLSDVTDPQALQLFDELGILTGIRRGDFPTYTVREYLQQTIYPHGGAQKKRPLDKRRIEDADDFDQFVLRRQVGKLDDYLHNVCKAIAEQHGLTVDHVRGWALYTLINRLLPQGAVRKSLRKRWERDMY